MARLQDLLAASQIGTRAAAAVPTSEPTDNTDLLGALSDIAGTGLGAVASVGNFLDLPGSSVRDLLAGENPFDQWMTPLSDENRISGRDLLTRRLGMRRNKETGMTGWLSDPGEGLRDLAGFATEVVLDPFGPVSAGVMAGTKAGRAVSLAAKNAHPMMRAVGRTVSNVFDKLPAQVQANLVKTPYRGLKALFNAPTKGVTNAVVQPLAESAVKASEAVRKAASADVADAVMQAEKVGFTLRPDKTLNAADPSTWSAPNSQLNVNAREQALYRYVEGVDEPTGLFTSKDLVHIGETPDLHEVEWTNLTDNGLQVKLVGDDNLYSDRQLKPGFMQSRVAVPDEVKSSADTIHQGSMEQFNKAKAHGLNIGVDHDTYLEKFVNRSKADELRQLEAAAGKTRPSWVRRGLSSLVSTLQSLGGRDPVYKGHKQGTSGMIDLFLDPRHQFDIETIDKMDVVMESPVAINGLHPKVVHGYVGPRHFDTIAERIGTTADELWADIAPSTSLNRTSAYTTPAPDGSHDILSNGAKVGGVAVRQVSPTEATIAPWMDDADFQAGAMHDTLPFIEKDLQAKGVNRISVSTTPEFGDTFWKSQGYRPDSIEGNTERWVKDVYGGLNGSDPKLSGKTMLPLDEAIKRLKVQRDILQAQIDAGGIQGVQPGVGWWKRWDDLTDPSGEKVFNFNMQKSGLAQLDPNTLHMSMFKKMEDFVAAKQALEKGREVYAGYMSVGKNKPTEFRVVSPTSKAKLALVWDKSIKELTEGLPQNPLLRTEATYDYLHQAITRNYGDRIDRWMPELDESGNSIATDASGPVHKATPGAWRKMMPELQDRLDNTKPLTKPMETLLRLDDDSLQALSFNPENIETIGKLRERLAEQTGSPIAQDTSIPVVDRHRALAQEVADHIEKRVAPLFSRSALAASLDYQTRIGSANSILDSIQGGLLGMWRSGAKETSAPDITVKFDPLAKPGATFGKAIAPIAEGGDEMFAGKVDTGTFLEETRQKFVASGEMADVDTPELIKAQIEQIKGIRAPAEVFEQMRTLNELGAAADLPELSQLSQIAATVTAITKAGQLSWARTAVRDGFSSFINGVLMGKMNPLRALTNRGADALALSRGIPVDPGEGIGEIESFLLRHGRESNPATRGEALQAMWAAHHAGGATHPNVFKADEAAMELADSSARLVGDIPNFGRQSLTEKLKAGVKDMQSTPGSWNPFNREGKGLFGTKGPLSMRKVAGAWTKDATGRPVQISKSNAWVEAHTAFRADIDTKNRALFVLDHLDQNKSLTAAFAESDRVLLNANPRNFTRFEHQYLKAFIPYYSFMRQSIPMFIQELVTNPGGRLGMVARTTRLGQGDEHGYVPFQYQDTTSIPLGQNDDGSLKYLTSFGLMHEDAIAYAGNALQRDVRGLLQKGLSSTNPAVKWLIEYSTNTSLFSQSPMGGRRLDDLDPSMGRLLANLGVRPTGSSNRPKPFGGPLIESMVAASPVSTMLSLAKISTEDKKRTKPVERLLRILSGVRVENVAQEQVTRDIRDRLNAIEIEYGARPLTTVIGAKGAIEEMQTAGDAEGAAKLAQIQKIQAVMRRLQKDKKQSD